MVQDTWLIAGEEQGWGTEIILPVAAGYSMGQTLGLKSAFKELKSSD